MVNRTAQKEILKSGESDKDSLSRRTLFFEKQLQIKTDDDEHRSNHSEEKDKKTFCLFTIF